MEPITLSAAETALIRVDDAEYTITFPLAAFTKAEKTLGKSLMSPAAWFNAPASDMPALLEAGLSTYHPKLTSAEVAVICERITPELYASLAEAFGALCFPRWLAKFKANLETLREASNKQATEGGE